MKHSEIFENFVKIAQEKGLISEAEQAEHTEKSFSETNPRHDSLSVEQIGKLYNTKPKLPEDMEYKKNIMEDAHPEPAVVSPSHDKLNGLVENNNERQNILLHIVNKTPDGHLTQRKYAHKNLLLSLVRVANALDNGNQEELRKLADVCLEQAADSKKKITKVGWVGVAIGVVAALLAAVYAKQHLRFHTDGFETDYQKTIAEIDDLLTSNTNWGVGYAYTPEFIQTVNQLKTVLAELNSKVQKIMPILDKIEKPRTKDEMTQMLQDPDSHEAIAALNDFHQEMDKIMPFIQKVELDFSNENYKQRVIAQKGFLTSLVDVPEILHGGAGLIADDFDDVKHALQALTVDLNNIAKDLQAAENYKQSLTTELQSAQKDVTKMFEPPKAPVTKTPVPTPTETAAPVAEEEGIGGLEKEFEGLTGGLFGR